MRVLIIDDDATIRTVLDTGVRRAGYLTTQASDGQEAAELLIHERFDAIIVDWMMPRMDGIGLINHVRENIHPAPLILMLTAMDSSAGRAHALKAGADYFLTKPMDLRKILESLEDGLKRVQQHRRPWLAPPPAARKPRRQSGGPGFCALAIAVSTGGPQTLPVVLSGLELSRRRVATFIVQHGPDWMLSDLAASLSEALGRAVTLATDGGAVSPDGIYLAPGDRHMVLADGGVTLRLKQGPKINYCRPAADPLFESVAEHFGPAAVGAVLTGLGRDGAHGVVAVHEAGGRMIIQTPEDAIAPFMPKAAQATGIVDRQAPAAGLGALLSEELRDLALRRAS